MANAPHPADVLLFQPIGSHYDGTTISSATTLTPPAGATKILIQALDANVRLTLDGSDPTATKGFQLVDGDPLIMLPLSPSTTVKVIQETATADIQYQWGQ